MKTLKTLHFLIPFLFTGVQMYEEIADAINKINEELGDDDIYEDIFC